MSASPLIAKLRRLRTEAGQSPPSPVCSPAPFLVPSTVLPERSEAKSKGHPRPISPDLRRLLQRHAQLRHGVIATPASHDRDVPGIELCPGLRYTETCVDWLDRKSTR